MGGTAKYIITDGTFAPKLYLVGEEKPKTYEAYAPKWRGEGFESRAKRILKSDVLFETESLDEANARIAAAAEVKKKHKPIIDALYEVEKKAESERIAATKAMNDERLAVIRGASQ